MGVASKRTKTQDTNKYEQLGWYKPELVQRSCSNDEGGLAESAALRLANGMKTKQRYNRLPEHSKKQS